MQDLERSFCEHDSLLDDWNDSDGDAVCDEDYQKWNKLLEHKMNSGNHICCGICGDVPCL